MATISFIIKVTISQSRGTGRSSGPLWRRSAKSQVAKEMGGGAKKDKLSVVSCLRDSSPFQEAKSLVALSAPKVTPL